MMFLCYRFIHQSVTKMVHSWSRGYLRQDNEQQNHVTQKISCTWACVHWDYPKLKWLLGEHILAWCCIFYTVKIKAQIYQGRVQEAWNAATWSTQQKPRRAEHLVAICFVFLTKCIHMRIFSFFHSYNSAKCGYCTHCLLLFVMWWVFDTHQCW